MRRFYLLVLILYLGFSNSTELCGLEPPKDGEGCSNDSQSLDLDKKWERELYLKSSYTSDKEWSHRNALDEADDYIIHDPDKAIQLFDDILKEVKSNRAIYARARTKQIHHSHTEEPKLLKEILNDFYEVLKDEEAEKTIWISAFNQMRSFFDYNIKLFFEKELEVLEYLTYNRTKDVIENMSLDKMVQDMLENLYAQGKFEEGVKAYERALNLTLEKETAFTSEYLNFLYGITLRQIPDRKREGNKILRGIVPEKVSYLSTLVEFFEEKCRQLGLNDVDIDKVLKEASKLHIIVAQDQKPTEFVEGIKNQPVWDLENDVEITVHEEEISTLIQNWHIIKEEAENLMKNMTSQRGWMSSPPSVNVTGNWSEYPLFSFGGKRHHRCQDAPKTCNLMKSFPAASKFYKGTIKFSVFTPGSKLHSFHGPSNAVLRAYLGLQVPTDVEFTVGRKDVLRLESGRVAVFDNSYDRTIANHSPTESLLVLSFDLPNPDLDAKAREAKYSREARNFFMF